jgi:uncharacterized protein (DUF1015 family)
VNDAPRSVPHTTDGLSLAPFRATRYRAGRDVGTLLSPPYDVISDGDRQRLVAAAEHNAVRLILPGAAEARLGGGDAYRGAAELMSEWLAAGVLGRDDADALFVYEMQPPDERPTRGLLGAVQLRSPDDGVILPHENTMAGPVKDRLALMTATEANLEPIYLVYDGGGAASDAVAAVSQAPPLVDAVAPDQVRHRLWAITDPALLSHVASDLATRRALIADGHHRYATYLQLQAEAGGRPGPWDRGLALLVDTSQYGPQVHPIHRVVAVPLSELVDRSRSAARLTDVSPADLTAVLEATAGFAAALTDGERAVIMHGLQRDRIRAVLGANADAPLGRLDVTVLHRVVVEDLWGLTDDERTVDYAHDVPSAIERARAVGGTAVLLRPTPVQAVADVAAGGGRMPRKSTLFTPKPASGMVFRRFADQTAM